LLYPSGASALNRAEIRTGRKLIIAGALSHAHFDGHQTVIV